MQRDDIAGAVGRYRREVTRHLSRVGTAGINSRVRVCVHRVAGLGLNVVGYWISRAPCYSSGGGVERFHYLRGFRSSIPHPFKCIGENSATLEHDFDVGAPGY